MTSTWTDLDQLKGLGKLNGYLANNSYITGYQSIVFVSIFNVASKKKNQDLLRKSSSLEFFNDNIQYKIFYFFVAISHPKTMRKFLLQSNPDLLIQKSLFI
jgi:hypothetical protein